MQGNANTTTNITINPLSFVAILLSLTFGFWHLLLNPYKSYHLANVIEP